MLDAAKNALSRVHQERRSAPAENPSAAAPAPQIPRSSARLHSDAAVHEAIRTQPERREAVYTRLVRTEPALIHHLETWRIQDAQAESIRRVDFPVAPGEAPATPPGAALRDRLGAPADVRVLPPGTADDATLPAQAVVLPRAAEALSPLPFAGLTSFVETAVPVARNLLAQAMARGSQLAGSMADQLTTAFAAAAAKAAATPASEAAIDEAVQAVQAERLPEQRAAELGRQAVDIETRYGRDAAIEVVARVVEADPAAFGQGMSGLAFVSPGSNNHALQGILGQGIGRAYDRAPGGEAGRATFAAQLIDGTYAGQGGFAVSEVAQLVGRSGNDALQVAFVEAGLDKAHALASTAGHWLVGADTLVATLGAATLNSPAAAQAVIDKALALDLGSYADDMHAAGTDSLNWVLNQFARGGGTDANGQFVDGFSTFMAAAVPADAPPYPGAPFSIPSTPLSDEQSWTLFNAVANDDGLLKPGVAATARLFENYAADWVDGGLMAGVGTGTLDDQFDPALQNFFEEALFNPNTDGAYRQALMGSVVGLFGDLSQGTLGAGMTSEARGRLAGGLMAIIDQGFDQHADAIRNDAATRQAWANFAIGLGFAFVPGPAGAAAKILVSQGVGQAKSVVQDTVAQLIQAGVSADTAQAAAEAANRGELLAAFDSLNLPDSAMDNVAEYIDLQQRSLASGDKTLGELFLDMMADSVIAPNEAFSEGVTRGYDQVQNREG